MPYAASPIADRTVAASRFRRGQIIHALLQHLPAVSESGRAEAARAWLARPGPGIAAEEAARRGARKLGLRVLGGNASARALYASAGFVVEGVLRDEFWLDGRFVDDVFMARPLP